MIFQPGLELMAPQDRRRVQDERLSSLVARLSNAGSSYWSRKLAGIDSGRVTTNDMTTLPFTTKPELRDTYPFGMLATPLERTIRIHASSGTRGKPTVVAYTAADINVFAEVNARSIACAGGTPDDVLHIAYGNGLFTGGLGLHYGGERLGATVVPASGGNPPFQLHLMGDLGASGLACTPSFAMLLAERARSEGLIGHLRIRYGVFGAEPWSDSFRTKLEEAWGGIDACDIYGLSEVMGPGIAMECREGKGALHVFSDHFYPEVVDPESGDPCEPGRLGELVLTTLTKEALPVIRYRTGDITTFVDAQCSCGRTFPRIARFSGRVDDMLVIRGVNVFPSEVEAVVLSDPDLGGQYAIVVDRRQTMPELDIRVELASADLVGREDAVADRLCARLLERLRLRTTVAVSPPDSIPRQEVGKAQRVFERTDEADPVPIRSK
jgi:phenylacetate-CoA ligase